MTGCLLVVVGTAVDAVTIVRIGPGARGVMVVGPGTAAVVLSSFVVLTVVTDSVDLATVADGTADVVVVPGLGATVGGPRVVDLVVTVGGLVAIVTLAVCGLTVDRSVTVILGVTLVVTGTLGVVLRVVREMVEAVVAGVALAVDTKRVVTLSEKIVVRGAADIVVCSGDQDGGSLVAAVVETSTLPATGCVVSVNGWKTTGLGLVVKSPGGAVVGAVVRGIAGAPGAGDGGVNSILVVVVAISSVEVVVWEAEVVTAADVAEVTTGFVVVTAG